MVDIEAVEVKKSVPEVLDEAMAILKVGGRGLHAKRVYDDSLFCFCAACGHKHFACKKKKV